MTTDNPLMEPDAFYAKEETKTELIETTVEEETEIETSQEEPATEEDETEEVEAETEAEETEEYVFEINGKEYTEDDIDKLEKGNMMQSDYSRKTAEIAETVKLKVADQVNSEMSELRNTVLELQATIEAEEIDLNELREDDPDEYIKVIERKQKQEKLLADAKAKLSDNAPSKEDEAAEQQKLILANPTWVEDGKPTKAYKADMELLNTFFTANEWSAEDQAQIGKSVYWQAILKAARFDELQKKVKPMKKKVKKAPVVKKPKGGVKKAAPKSDADLFYS